MKSTTEDILEIARQKGIVRSCDVVEHGIARTTLAYLEKKGVLRRIARGVYVPVDRIAEYETFQAVAVAVPHGVLCLLSALQFHEMTTQMPVKVWIAIERRQTVPRVSTQPVRIVKLSGLSYSEGIEEHAVDGVQLRVYCPAKTVVDCFKFRNRVGLDVAREALVDCLSQKKATRDEIYHFAGCCRMARVMRPYLEMVS